MGYISRNTKKQDFAKRILTLPELIQKLEAYCTYRDRCTSEISTKLNELGADPNDTDAVIQHLQENNFYNDARFAFAFARGKQRYKKWGIDKITNELKRKKIDQNIIKEAIQELDQGEMEQNLLVMMERKASQLESKNKPNIKQHLIQFAFQKGYPYTEIKEVLNTLKY